jgi:hypothetical protein
VRERWFGKAGALAKSSKRETRYRLGSILANEVVRLLEAENR